MNLCDALFSGFFAFPEECSSSLLGYLFAPLQGNFGHGCGSELLKDFLRRFIPADHPRFAGIADGILAELENCPPEKLFPGTMGTSPFSKAETAYRMAIVMEYNQIDLLVRVGSYVLAVENKIRQGAVKAPDKQLEEYCSVLPEDCAYIPIVILPDEKCSLVKPDVLTLYWHREEQKEMSILGWLREKTEEYPDKLGILQDFLDMAENYKGHPNGFYGHFRPPLRNAPEYENILELFPNQEIRSAVERFFPQGSQTVMGFDSSGGSLIRVLKFSNHAGVCYPFRVTPGKFEIQASGFNAMAPANISGEEQKLLCDTLRLLVKIRLEEAGMKFGGERSFKCDLCQLTDEKVQKEYETILDEFHRKGKYTPSEAREELWKWQESSFCREDFSRTLRNVLEHIDTLDDTQWEKKKSFFRYLDSLLNVPQK